MMGFEERGSFAGLVIKGDAHICGFKAHIIQIDDFYVATGTGMAMAKKSNHSTSSNTPSFC